MLCFEKKTLGEKCEESQGRDDKIHWPHLPNPQNNLKTRPLVDEL